MSAFDSTVEALTATLKDQFDLVPKIGFEVEFYLHDAKRSPVYPSDADWRMLRNLLRENGAEIEALKEEEGRSQFEVCLPILEPMEAIARMRAFRLHLEAWATAQGWVLDFTPRVFDDQPSSALHTHVHLENAAGDNVFSKDEDEELSAPLAHAIAGLLAMMPASMVLFAPDAVSYERYTEWEKHTPSKYAWGNNNRTTPIRLPAPETPSPYRHIEHRLAAAHADCAAVLSGVLAGILYGLQEAPELPECIYGDARERNHPELENLPRSFDEAWALFEEDERLGAYLQAEASDALKVDTASHNVAVG